MTARAPLVTRELIRLAWRNLTRHRVRNGLLGGSVALATGLLAFTLCVGAGIRTQLVRHVIEAEGGAVVVDLTGALQTHGVAARVDSLERFLRAQSGVRAVRRRVQLRAIVYIAGRSAEVALEGIDPTREPSLVAGASMTTGRFPLADSGSDIVLSDVLVARLRAHAGDECQLMAQTSSGSMNVVDCRIGGAFRAAARDEGTAYATLVLAQQLFDATLPSALLVDLDDIERADDIADATRARFASTDERLEVSTYRGRVGLASSIANVNSYSSAAFVACLLLIASVGIATAVMSNVAERTSELGMLAALGFTRAQLLCLMMAETFFLSAAASLLGIALGALAAGALRISGFDIGTSASLAFGVRVLRPELAPGRIAVALAIGMLQPLAFALLPARRGTRLSPIEALRSTTI